MKFKKLRAYLSSLEELPAFLISLVSSNSKPILVCMNSITKRLTLSSDLLKSLDSKKFFSLLYRNIGIFDDDVVSVLSLEVLAQFAQIGFSNDYLLFTDDLKSSLYRGTRLSRTAFSTLYTLSFHSECASEFRQLKINEDIINNFNTVEDEKNVNTFLRNLKSKSNV